jgi:pyruvate dehydrogenase kinase 2/3/4
MRRMLTSRISRRVLAEHHLALSMAQAKYSSGTKSEPHVGIIFTGLDVKKSVHRCINLLREQPIGTEADSDGVAGHTQWPEVIVDGHPNVTFPYIKDQFE